MVVYFLCLFPVVCSEFVVECDVAIELSYLTYYLKHVICLIERWLFVSV